MSTPPVQASLSWSGDKRFAAESGTSRAMLDGDGVAGPSPMHALAFGLAGCMAVDVVEILTKGRHPITGCEVTLTGERAPVPPRRFVRLALHFVLTGALPEAAVERAFQLSRDTYCSVWQSMRQDIDFAVTFEVRA